MKLICLLLFLCACEKKLDVASHNPDDYGTLLLFEKDGCKVYRFFDWGNARYFSNCSMVGGQ